MQAVLDAPDPRARDGVRDRAMLHLAFAAGLRVSELVGLRLDDVTLQPQPAIHVRGKGRRERVLPLWKTTTKALRAWLALRGSAACPELFLNARGGPLTRDGFEHILAKHVKIATATTPSLKKKRVSPHVLRHSCAMHTLDARHPQGRPLARPRNRADDGDLRTRRSDGEARGNRRGASASASARSVPSPRQAACLAAPFA